METADPTDALVRGNNAFALDLYGRLAQGDGNRFLSPLSISTALAMTYAGADGETASQMAKALHFDLPAERLHPAFHRLTAELQGRTSALPGSTEVPDVQLFTGNALWIQSGETILSDFRKRIEVNYRGGIHPIDFRVAAEAARRTINVWVEEQTRDKIKDLLKPGAVNASTLLVLTNAIYFKALWASPFAAEKTHPGEFQTATGEKSRVDLMNQTDRFRYLEEGSFQALELPYKGNTLGMVILLPRTPDGLEALESSLTPEKLAGWLAKLSSHRVQVSIPKFRLTGEFDLKGSLSGLGMTDAFRPGVADFSGMTGTREIAISAVVHKAFIEVEEKGTEAAAATAVKIVGLARVADPPTVFRADHPFLFLIRDLRNGGILFIGRLVRPES
jgi:serpin B